jgi:hypothetical protein
MNSLIKPNNTPNIIQTYYQRVEDGPAGILIQSVGGDIQLMTPQGGVYVNGPTQLNGNLTIGDGTTN